MFWSDADDVANDVTSIVMSMSAGLCGSALMISVDTVSEVGAMSVDAIA